MSEFSVRLADFVFQCNRATLAAITAFAQAAGATDTQITPDKQHASYLPETALASIGETPTSPKARASTSVNSSSPFTTPIRPGPYDAQSTTSDVPRGRQSTAGSVTIERLEVHFNAAEETLGVITVEGAVVLVDMETLGTDVRWLTRGTFGRLVLDAPIEGRGVMRLWDAVPNADSCQNRFSVGTLPLDSCRREGSTGDKVETGGHRTEALSFRDGRTNGEKEPVISKDRDPATTANSTNGEPGLLERFQAAATSESSNAYADPEAEELVSPEVDANAAAPNVLKIAVTVQQVHAILFGTFITRATAYFTHEEWASGHIFADDTPTLSGLSEDVILSVPEDESASPEESLTVVYDFSITDCILDLPSTLEEPQSRTFPQVALPHLTVGFSLLGNTCTVENEPQLSMSLSVEGRGLSLTTWGDALPEKGGWKTGVSEEGRERDAVKEKALGGLIDGLHASLGVKWFTAPGGREGPPMELTFDSPGLQVNLTSESSTPFVPPPLRCAVFASSASVCLCFIAEAAAHAPAK